MHMTRILMIAMLFGPACALASGAPPHVEGKGIAAALVMPAAVKRAIDKVAPGFRPWQMRDYLDWQEDADPHASSVPYAAIGDINNDGMDDLVIDGHTKKENMRLAVLSSPHGYRAVVVEHYGTADPIFSKDYDEKGKVHTGLNFFLFFSPEPKKTDKSYAFSEQWVQVRDSDGEWEGDADTADYFYRKGKFVGPCTYFDPCPAGKTGK